MTHTTFARPAVWQHPGGLEQSLPQRVGTPCCRYVIRCSLRLRARGGFWGAKGVWGSMPSGAPWGVESVRPPSTRTQPSAQPLGVPWRLRLVSWVILAGLCCVKCQMNKIVRSRTLGGSHIQMIEAHATGNQSRFHRTNTRVNHRRPKQMKQMGVKRRWGVLSFSVHPAERTCLGRYLEWFMQQLLTVKKQLERTLQKISETFSRHLETGKHFALAMVE